MKVTEGEAWEWISLISPMKQERWWWWWIQIALAAQAYLGISLKSLMICLKASFLLHGGKHRTENSQANKSSQVCKDSDMGVPAPATMCGKKCERCPSLPLMHLRVVDWFFFPPHRRGCLNVLMHCSVTEGCLGKLPFLQTDLPFDWMRPG